MKVVDIDRVVILMRFIQYGWSEERKKAFDDSLRMMLETQCEDLTEHDKQIRAEERNKILDAVYDCGWHCEVHTREALDEMVTEQLKGNK